MKFIVKGKQFDVAREDVLHAVERLDPEPITKWSVDVGDVLYPVKQVFGAATGLRRQEFISTTARDKLAQLGFAIHGPQPASQTGVDGELPDRSDVEIVIDAVRGIEIGAIDTLGSEYGYPNLALCLVDAVFSIGIRYTTTRRVVERFCLWWDSDVGKPAADDSALSLSVFHAVLSQLRGGGESEARDMAKEVFGNLNRTASKNGILKAEAVLEAAEACLAFGVDTKQDLLDLYGDAQFEDAFRSVPGQSSGVSLRYLYMLAGHHDEGKPDRMVLRFLGRHLGYMPDGDTAISLLRQAAEQMRKDGFGVTVRELDHAIWRIESSNLTPVEQRAAPRTKGRSKYRPLAQYLRDHSADRVELSYADIEQIIGAPLPPSAHRHAAFWANHYGGTHVWATAWMDAGWKVSSYSLTSERVVFERVSPPRE